MSKQIWAPWRMEYIKDKDTGSCVFCEGAIAGHRDRAAYRILAGRADEFVVLNKYPYVFGHILICPRRHVSSLEDLLPKEQESLFRLAIDAQIMLKSILNPHGINWGINIGKQAGAGIEAHLHVHIVPRWEGDTNFMPVVADCHIMPGHLDKLYAQLIPEFSRLDS
ncbi:MAG: HIT domain-containing protein [Deltaproteobacteria bacterium]|nr:HIT domain-containing protein [Deltaproteobacteria bacterium]